MYAALFINGSILGLVFIFTGIGLIINEIIDKIAMNYDILRETKKNLELKIQDLELKNEELSKELETIKQQLEHRNKELENIHKENNELRLFNNHG